MPSPEMISGKPEQVKDDIISLVRSKFPGKKAFITEIPFHGFFVYRPQEMGDVKAIATKVTEYVENEIENLGGAKAIDSLPEDEKNKTIRNLDLEAGDISTNTALGLCVLYPFDFKDQIAAGTVPAGIGPALLQKIVEVSGWGDVSVDEI